MNPPPTYQPNAVRTRVGVVVAALGVLVAIPASAQAATAPVPLGTAKSFVVLAGAGVTNTGKTTLNGNVGTFPTKAISGLSTLTLNGTNHAGDAVTQGAKKDLTTAYTAAAGAGPTKAIPVELGGKTLQPGVYSGGALGLTGTLTLDGGNNPDAVFIFKAASTLITASASRVKLVNVNPCNVFWQVTSSATLGTGSKFVGTIMALTDINLTTGATLSGRALARNGAVTLQANTISLPRCSQGTTTPAPTGNQVSTVPAGGVQTGDGSTSGTGNNVQALWVGAFLLITLGVATGVTRRHRPVTS
jgi:type VI secretion system secreted protein VgrG